MREMRLHKREVTDLRQIREILEECQVMRLGTADEEGIMIVPVNFGYELEEDQKKLRLYFHSAKEGRKADAFLKNPEVAVEMDCRHGLIKGDYACAYSYSFASIMGKGVLKKAETLEEKAYGLTLIMNHCAPGEKAEFSKEALERTDVYCIHMTDFTGKCRMPKKQEE